MSDKVSKVRRQFPCASGCGRALVRDRLGIEIDQCDHCYTGNDAEKLKEFRAQCYRIGLRGKGAQ